MHLYNYISICGHLHIGVYIEIVCPQNVYIYTYCCAYLAARSHLSALGHIAGVRAFFSARELKTFKMDALSLYQNSLSLGWETEGTKDPNYSALECFDYAQA